jgi:hypothetical protein
VCVVSEDGEVETQTVCDSFKSVQCIMSEQKRATLTPFGKSDKKCNKSPRKTFRLQFTLSDPNENSCPVFDYAATVKSEEVSYN